MARYEGGLSAAKTRNTSLPLPHSMWHRPDPILENVCVSACLTCCELAWAAASYLCCPVPQRRSNPSCLDYKLIYWFMYMFRIQTQSLAFIQKVILCLNSLRVCYIQTASLTPWCGFCALEGFYWPQTKNQEKKEPWPGPSNRLQAWGNDCRWVKARALCWLMDDGGDSVLISNGFVRSSENAEREQCMWSKGGN